MQAGCGSSNFIQHRSSSPAWPHIRGGNGLAEIKASGIMTVRAIAGELNRQRITSPRGGQWSKSTVAVLLSRFPA